MMRPISSAKVRRLSSTEVIGRSRPSKNESMSSLKRRLVTIVVTMIMRVKKQGLWNYIIKYDSDEDIDGGNDDGDNDDCKNEKDDEGDVLILMAASR